MTAAQCLRACRTLYGGGLLLAPASVLSILARMPLDPQTLAVARVLGARHLAQAALSRRGTRTQLRLGAASDAAHAASMVVVARCSARRAHRVLARRDARTATLLAALGLVTASAR